MQNECMSFLSYCNFNFVKKNIDDFPKSTSSFFVFYLIKKGEKNEITACKAEMYFKTLLRKKNQTKIQDKLRYWLQLNQS